MHVAEPELGWGETDNAVKKEVIVMSHRGVIEDGCVTGVARIFHQEGARAHVLIFRACKIPIKNHS